MKRKRCGEDERKPGRHPLRTLREKRRCKHSAQSNAFRHMMEKLGKNHLCFRLQCTLEPVLNMLSMMKMRDQLIQNELKHESCENPAGKPAHGRETDESGPGADGQHDEAADDSEDTGDDLTVEMETDIDERGPDDGSRKRQQHAEDVPEVFHGAGTVQMLEKDLETDENEDRAAECFGAGLEPCAEERADPYPRSRDQEGDHADHQHGEQRVDRIGRGQDADRHRDKGDAHCEGVDGGRDREKKHGFEAQIILLFFFLLF